MLNTGEAVYDANSEDESYADDLSTDEQLQAQAEVESQSLVSRKRTTADAHYAEDRDYLEVLRDMQQGQWDRVVPMLRALQARYPAAKELDALLQEASFRASLESNWGDKVKGLQSMQFSLRSLLPVIPVVVLIGLLVVGVIFWGRIQRVNALSDQQQELLVQAQSALTAGQFREALDLFETVLADNPESAEALKGQSETKRQMKLANDYQLALDRMASGNYKQALELLLALEAEAPGYRDVAARIAEAKTQTGAPQLFAEAEFAYSNNLWLSAIAQYEELRSMDADYEADAVKENLAGSYLKAGQQMVSVRPSDSTLPKQAQDYFRKSLQMVPNATAEAESQLLETFMGAESLVQQSNYEQGAKILSEIYADRADYFGGYAGELLFRSYMGIAELAVQQGNLERAQAAYQRALDLGFDNATAQQQLQKINSLIAPPTVVPETVFASAAASAPVNVAPVPTPTPVDPLTQYRGWIAFRSNRNGVDTYYIMRGDGTEQQPAPAEIVNSLGQLYQKQQWSPDGLQMVYVKQVSEKASTNIFKVRADLPSDWDRDIMLTDYAGTEYDPIWSPDGNSIAFVSNHTGNDEIWIMNGDGGNQRQLTFNDWQWDKRPSFSPDSTQIVYYSNISGARQVWVMNSDGSGRKNISNNAFEDWEPVWIW